MTAKGSRRIAVIPAVSVMLVLAAGSAGAEEARRPVAYDVTVAGLERYRDADLRLMTPAAVTRHVDGDTFEVAVADPPHGMRTAELVRLMGIDTPELGQPLAEEALDHVRRRVGDGSVYLAFDFQRRDRFGRLLAFVYLPDGTLLNADLIEHCLATVYRGDDLMFFLAQFEELERTCSPDDGVVIAAIRNAGRNEHVVLRNAAAEPADVSGYGIRDDDGDGVTVPAGVVIEPGDTLAVCSGAGCVGTPDRSVHVSEKNIWGNSGDVACLKDRSGTVVDAHAYGSQTADTCEP